LLNGTNAVTWRSEMKKPLAITAVLLGLAAAAPIGSALAHPVAVRIDAPEFGIRIGFPAPRVFLPAPVIYAPPPPVYAPQPVYYPAPYYSAPYYPAPYYRARFQGPYPHHHRHWDDRQGRWCD
jgi:hypothetical protein